jgi:hypothetical protein
MKGAALSLTVASTPTPILGITSIDDILGQEVSMIDVTELLDTAKQSLAGLIDWGELNFKLNLDPTNAAHISLIAAAAPGAGPQTFKVTLPNGTATTVIVIGPIKTLKRVGGDTGGKYMAQCSVKINSVTEGST